MSILSKIIDWINYRRPPYNQRKEFYSALSNAYKDQLKGLTE